MKIIDDEAQNFIFLHCDCIALMKNRGNQLSEIISDVIIRDGSIPKFQPIPILILEFSCQLILEFSCQPIPILEFSNYF